MCLVVVRQVNHITDRIIKRPCQIQGGDDCTGGTCTAMLLAADIDNHRDKECVYAKRPCSICKRKLLPLELSLHDSKVCAIDVGDAVEFKLVDDTRRSKLILAKVTRCAADRVSVTYQGKEYMVRSIEIVKVYADLDRQATAVTAFTPHAFAKEPSCDSPIQSTSSSSSSTPTIINNRTRRRNKRRRPSRDQEEIGVTASGEDDEEEYVPDAMVSVEVPGISRRPRRSTSAAAAAAAAATASISASAAGPRPSKRRNTSS